MNSEMTRVGIDAVATMLLHSLWQATLVALVLAAMLRVVPRQSAVWRYRWSVAAIAAVLVWMALTFGGVWGPAGVAAESAVASHWADIAEAAGVAPASGDIGQNPVILPSWKVAAVALWLLGAGFFSLRLGIACRQIRSLRRSATPMLDLDVLMRFERLRARLGVARKVLLLVSEKVQSPLTVGWWKPVVIVPASMLTALPLAYWEAIFAHELMHIRRSDFLWNLLALLVRSVLFYHPAVAWIVRQMQREREAACDFQAVTEGHRSKAGYAAALVAVDECRARFSFGTESANGYGLAMAAVDRGSGASLVDRIERLQGGNTQRRSGGGHGVAFLVVLGLAAGAAAVGWFAGDSDTSTRSAKAVIELRTPEPAVQADGTWQEAMLTLRAAINAIKTPVIWRPSEQELLRPKMVIEVAGVARPFGVNDPPVFGGIDNAWVSAHGLNFRDANLALRDPDGDGFSNREEFVAATSPVAAQEHPPLIGKLKLLNKRQQSYVIKFSAQPDERSVQLTREVSAIWEKKTGIVRIGETTADGQIEVLAIDTIGYRVHLRHLPTGKELWLAKREQSTFSIDYAELQLSIGKSDSFFVKVGDGFRIDADSGEWRLESVTDDAATVRPVSGGEAIVVGR